MPKFSDYACNKWTDTCVYITITFLKKVIACAHSLQKWYMFSPLMVLIGLISASMSMIESYFRPFLSIQLCSVN